MKSTSLASGGASRRSTPTGKRLDLDADRDCRRSHDTIDDDVDDNNNNHDNNNDDGLSCRSLRCHAKVFSSQCRFMFVNSSLCSGVDEFPAVFEPIAECRKVQVRRSIALASRALRYRISVGVRVSVDAQSALAPARSRSDCQRCVEAAGVCRRRV